MRSAELIHIVVFSFLLVLAWARPLPAPRRVKVAAIGIAGLAANITAAYVLPRLLPALAASVVRDWLPAAMVLLVYWQAGGFFIKANEGFQDFLERLDARTLAPLLNWLSRSRSGRWVAGSLELAYLLCYPMVPMSMATLYLLRLGRHADSFWTVVLVSTYLSYGVLPFLQTLPPRALDEPWHAPPPRTPVRQFNLWILRNASIHANTFPSAHVAAATAAALFFVAVAPWPVAAVFLAIALGIALGTFAGRYHFAADAAAGSALAAIVFLIARSVRGF
jgi:membrane-associated phospholipid phosphatase